VTAYEQESRRRWGKGSLATGLLSKEAFKMVDEMCGYRAWKSTHGITGFIDRDLEKNRLQQEERERKRLLAENTCPYYPRLSKKDREDCRSGEIHRNWC
jgi:hypothetical protein